MDGTGEDTVCRVGGVVGTGAGDEVWCCSGEGLSGDAWGRGRGRGVNWAGRIAISWVGRIVRTGTECWATRGYGEGRWRVDYGGAGCAGSGRGVDCGGTGCFMVDLMSDVASLRTGRGTRGVESGCWYGVGAGAGNCYKGI